MNRMHTASADPKTENMVNAAQLEFYRGSEVWILFRTHEEGREVARNLPIGMHCVGMSVTSKIDYLHRTARVYGASDDAVVFVDHKVWEG